MARVFGGLRRQATVTERFCRVIGHVHECMDSKQCGVCLGSGHLEVGPEAYHVPSMRRNRPLPRVRSRDQQAGQRGFWVGQSLIRTSGRKPAGAAPA